MGVLELPSKSYYRYEFTTSNGLHVCMAAGAQRGKVYVLGASVAKDKWPDVAERLRRVSVSFRMKDGSIVM